MIRVFIADDHDLVRTCLRQLLSREPDMQIVGEAADGPGVVQALEHTPCDLLVLDLSLPRLSGREVLRQVTTAHPTLPVIILSAYPRESHEQPLLQAGAAAFLSKDDSQFELVEAIRCLAEGQRFELASRVGVGSWTPPVGLEAHAALSPREYQVFVLFANGQNIPGICRELALTPGVVFRYLSQVEAKLGLHSSGELVEYAEQVGLVG